MCEWAREEGDTRVADVVVDGLGNTDHTPIALDGVLTNDTLRTIATDDDERIELERAVAGQHGVLGVLGEGLVERLEHGATRVQQRIDLREVERVCVERHRLSRHEAVRAVRNAEHLPAERQSSVRDHGANDGVQTGTVAAAGHETHATNGAAGAAR